jgi:gamma-glutamylcyclotransferase (GGCT)/AIG2-like uncharacterized protein YtfP
MATFRLFVYGTLRRGQLRHRYLGESRYLGAVRTESGYTLYHLGEYPGLKVGDGIVEGELYEVPETQLAVLDAVEGAPDLFHRGPVVLEDGQEVVAYFYVPAVRGERRILRGVWSK